MNTETPLPVTPDIAERINGLIEERCRNFAANYRIDWDNLPEAMKRASRDVARPQVMWDRLKELEVERDALSARLERLKAEHAGLVAEICERLDCDDESILIALDQLDEARQDAQRTNGELHKQWQAKYDTLAAQVAALRERGEALLDALEAPLDGTDFMVPLQNAVNRFREALSAAPAPDARVGELRDTAAEMLAALEAGITPRQHKDGCLHKANPRMPCQCGAFDRDGEVLRQIRTAIEHGRAALAPQGEQEGRGSPASHPGDRDLKGTLPVESTET